MIGVTGIILGVFLFKMIERRYMKLNGALENEFVAACKTKSWVLIGLILIEKNKSLKRLLLRQKQLTKKIQQAYGMAFLEKRRDFFMADQVALGGILFWLGMCVLIGSVGGKIINQMPQNGLLKPNLKALSNSNNDRYQTVYYSYKEKGAKTDGSVDVDLLPYVNTKNELLAYVNIQLEQLSTNILGQNKNGNVIEYNLKLPKIDSTGIIHYSYQSSNQELVTDYGELRRLNPIIFGKKVIFKIIAQVMWQGETIQVEKNIPLQIASEFTNSKMMEEWVQQQIESEITAQNINKDVQRIVLPTSINGMESHLAWNRPTVLPKLLTGIGALMLLTIGIMFLKQYELIEIRAAREQQIQNEFPEFVQKLLLLLYTGMSISQALARMGQVHEVKRDKLIYTALQDYLQLIRTGRSELEALEDFGQKIGTKEFSRFISTLLQGIRKGNGTMMAQIEVLAKESWDQRIINARQLGEKASSKLILPMGLILIAIIIMVITPAWVSIQI